MGGGDLSLGSKRLVVQSDINVMDGLKARVLGPGIQGEEELVRTLMDM